MTWRAFSYLLLVIVISSLAVRPAIAAGPASPPPAKEALRGEIRALIEQLADRDTEKRETATKRFLKIGTPAKAQLEAASKNDGELDVIRRKAKVLLLSINRRDQVNRWTAFVSGKSADAPPGWKMFRLWAGGEHYARKLYVDIYRAEPKLLQAYAKDPAKAALLIEPLCVKRAMNIGPHTEVPIQSVIAYLFVAGDPKANLSSQAAKGLLHMMDLMRFSLPLEHSQFASNLKEGPNKPLLRKLLSRWIKNSKYDRWTISSILLVAVEYDFKEGLSVALEVLQELNTLGDGPLEIHEDVRYKMSILTIGQLGSSKHIEKIESLLKESKVLSQTELNGKPTNIQVRDLALIAILHLTGQKPKDYDVENVGDRLNLRSVFSVRYYFANDEQRKEAFAKWHEWRKNHPMPSPELIYIASESQASPGKSFLRDLYATGFASTN